MLDWSFNLTRQIIVLAMNTTTTRPHNQNLELKDVAATLAFAAQVGSHLKGGEVIELIGDLGAGKTTLVIGLARGAGITEQVSSPSFTIRNDYSAKALTIAHFDLFRLNDPGELRELLAETLSEPKTVVVIEWADSLSHILPLDRVKITLRPMDRDSRVLKLSYPLKYAYLFEGVL